MKKTKQQRQLRASNAAHERLNKINSDRYSKTHRDVYQQRAMYHGSCVIRQEKSGRMLTRDERKKVFDDVVETFW